jgi:hypothetical protein
MSLENLPPGACIDPALHPELTERKRYVRLEYDGNVCIVEPDDVDDMIEDHDPDADPIKQSDVWMTAKEFEDLPEFEGW